jgi:hypothetical protein
MTVILESSDNVFDFAGGNGAYNPFVPEVGDIVFCYIHPVVSQCELTIRRFPLLMTAIAITGFRQRLFNSLGEMIVLGTRLPRLQRMANTHLSTRKGPRMSGGPYHPRRIRWVKTLGKLDFGVATFWWTSVVAVTNIAGVVLWIKVSSGLNITLHWLVSRTMSSSKYLESRLLILNSI